MPSDEALPDMEQVALFFEPIRRFMQEEEQARVRGFLDRLAPAPPQVLLLEGGSLDDRLAAAHYFSLLLNCAPQNKTAENRACLPGLPALAAAQEDENTERPCLSCPVCVRMISHLHRDCFFLDGTAGSIKIDEVRALREVLGEAPREAAKRVVIFREAQALVEPAANALLKSFEEPRPGTVFMLLVPQRERLLPTLVSRSLCLTLPWPQKTPPSDSLIPWEAALCAFLSTGRGLFEQSGAKGAVDAPLVHAISGLCQWAMANCLLARQTGKDPAEGLEKLFSRLPEARLRMVDEALAECQDSLIYGVNPTLVLEWLATRLYLLLPRAGRGLS